MYLRQWGEEKFDTIHNATGGSASGPDIKFPDDHEFECTQVRREPMPVEGEVDILPNQQIPIPDQIIIDNSVIDKDLEDRQFTSPRHNADPDSNNSYRNQGAKLRVRSSSEHIGVKANQGGGGDMWCGKRECIAEATHAPKWGALPGREHHVQLNS